MSLLKRYRGDPSRKGNGFVPELLQRLHRYFAGEPVSFADVPLDEDWGTPFQAALAAALRDVPWGEVVSYGELSALAGRPRAARAAGTFCAENRFSLFVPCHRVVSVGGIGGYGSLGVELQAPPARARRARARAGSLTTSAPSSPRSRRSAAAAGSPRSRRSSTPPARPPARPRRVALHLDLATSGSRAAPSRSCASSGSAPRSAPTAAARSTAPRATSSTSRGTSAALGMLVEAGVLDPRHAPLERPPKRVVGRACCRGAYLRGALLGGGSLSGPRSPHLELRTTSLEGAEFLRSVAAVDDVRLGVLDRGRHAVAYAKGLDAIEAVLSAAGAGDTVLAFEERSIVAAARGEANRLANADHANLVRTSRAAQDAARSASARSRPPARSSACPSACTRSPGCGSATRPCRCASWRQGATRRAPKHPFTAD